MTVIQQTAESPHAILDHLASLSDRYGTTPLLDLPELAGQLGIGRLYAKDESGRTLGSFKSLGGTYAALRALARFRHADLAEFLREEGKRGPLPALLTASAGNHGLAVAAAARFAGARARIFLYPGVSKARRRRIEEAGAEIVDIDGTYDDAVTAARAAADAGGGILVPDTSSDPNDPIVADVMAGYGVLSHEIRQQLDRLPQPTHVFVQAGVGGLAAALVAGLKDFLDPPARFVVVEPRSAACVAAALREGSVTRVSGALATAATMLACGEASEPALKALLGKAEVIDVAEADLLGAPEMLRAAGGPGTTPSGAAGLAGLHAALVGPALRARLQLDHDSRVLVVVTEGPLKEETEGE
jgi:diaminopropionate ammonia-lyase